MFARAFVVLLLVLNLGVAAWWALRAPPAAPVPVQLPAGVPRLRLLGETASRAPDPAPVAAAPVAVALPADAVCAALGPFATPDARRQARAALQAQLVSARDAERSSGRVRGWRVIVPPLPTPEAAAALAERIRAAGITDYFVMREGTDTNAIALGRYRSEASARERAAALTTAGFGARAEPIGGGPLQPWLEVAARAGFDAATAATSLGLPPPAPLDCAALAAGAGPAG